MNRWLPRSLFPKSRRPARRPRTIPLRLEQLEDRTAPAVITVTTAMDDNNPNDGSVSLREAIQAINAGSTTDTDILNQNPGTFGTNDTINFNISAAGTVQTINVGVPPVGPSLGTLPALMKPMTINGYTEVGASMNTLANGDNAKILIELNGANAGPGADGLLVTATGAGSTIEGLAINRFSLNGIELQGAATVQGNFVGTNPQGNAAEPNQNDGIHISNSSASTIGGTTPAARNIASGNQIDGIHVVGSTAAPATNNVIEGNFVGVNAAGTGSVGIKAIGAAAGTPAGNFVFGIEISGGNGNTVGGATAAARNVVGFNAAGIEVDNGGQGNIIQGNNSGVGADNMTPVGNNQHGIVLRSDDNLSPPLGPGQTNEPAVSGNVIGLNPNTGFSGLGNLVEFNGTGGIAVFGNPLPNNASPLQNAGNSILGNSVFENGRGFATASSAPTPLLGIDLTNGFVFPRDDGFTANDSKGHGAAADPNNFQNFPILSQVVLAPGGVKITGTFTEAAEPNTLLRIEFYANNPDPLGLPAEGQTFLGAITVTTNASGVASFSVTLSDPNVSTNQVFTADATNLTPDPSAQAMAVNTFSTSEFSPSVALPPPPSATGIPPLVSVAFGPSGLVTEVVNSAGVLTQFDAAGAHTTGGGARAASVAFIGGSELLLVTLQSGALIQSDASGMHVIGTSGVLSASVAIGPSGAVYEVVNTAGVLTQFDAAGAHTIGGGASSASVAFAPSGEVLLVTLQSGALFQGDAAGQHMLQASGVRAASTTFPPFGQVVDIIFADTTLWQFDPSGSHRIGMIG
jgi:CSLREA domain-containing protein